MNSLIIPEKYTKILHVPRFSLDSKIPYYCLPLILFVFFFLGVWGAQKEFSVTNGKL